MEYMDDAVHGLLEAEASADPCAADVTQGRIDALRGESEPWVPPAPSSPSVTRQRMTAPAMLREHLEAERERTRRRLAELDRRKHEVLRARLAVEPVKGQHYALQQRCPTEDVDGWVSLAETAEDLLELEAGTLDDAEARAVLAEVAQRLDDLERELADRGRSNAGRIFTEECRHVGERHRSGGLSTENCEQKNRPTSPQPLAVDRWSTDDDAGPASLGVRQPAVSGAP